MKAWMSTNFGKFAIKLRPLIDVRIDFSLNILKTNRQIKVVYTLSSTRSTLVLLNCKFAT